MVSQLFVLGSSVPKVAVCLRTCCAAQKPRSPRHVRVSRGAKQVLQYLQRSKKQRRFHLTPPQDGWICLWEEVDYTDFADPRIAYQLSAELHTETFWLDLNEDYNVWAFQHFSKGKVVAQEHQQPKSYFTSSAIDPEEMDSYPGVTTWLRSSIAQPSSRTFWSVLLRQDEPSDWRLPFARHMHKSPQVDRRVWQVNHGLSRHSLSVLL